jgi:hypothetical protein
MSLDAASDMARTRASPCRGSNSVRYRSEGSRLAADQKDLIRKSAVIHRDNRYTELFKALAQSQLRGKPIHPDSALRQ